MQELSQNFIENKLSLIAFDDISSRNSYSEGVQLDSSESISYFLNFPRYLNYIFNLKTSICKEILVNGLLGIQSDFFYDPLSPMDLGYYMSLNSNIKPLKKLFNIALLEINEYRHLLNVFRSSITSTLDSLTINQLNYNCFPFEEQFKSFDYDTSNYSKSSLDSITECYFDELFDALMESNKELGEFEISGDIIDQYIRNNLDSHENISAFSSLIANIFYIEISNYCDVLYHGVNYNPDTDKYYLSLIFYSMRYDDNYNTIEENELIDCIDRIDDTIYSMLDSFN